MKSFFTRWFILGIFSLFYCSSIVAQTPGSSPGDTLRTIQILQGKSLREKTLDSSTSLQTIAGSVILKEGLTLFYCDSASINKKTNILEAFGNVHINQNDSIHTYSQYLKYIGQERMAYLKKEVRLTDKKGTLYTQELEYDLKSSIGKYFNGGRVVNGKTTLTSTEGIYYADTKDVYFKKNVHLVDPKYDLRNDTLLYNTQSQVTSWNTATVIKSKNGGDIYSSNGTYDLKNGKAFFGSRTIVKDSSRTYIADNIAGDDSTGQAQLEGNAVIKDSANGYTVLGRTIYLNKKDNSFLATGKPVLIFKGEGNDSTFVAGDTLFSGIERRDSLGRKIVVSKDTLKKRTVVNVIDSTVAVGGRKDSSLLAAAIQDSTRVGVTDSSLAGKGNDTTKMIAVGGREDSSVLAASKRDSARIGVTDSSLAVKRNDTTKLVALQSSSPDSTRKRTQDIAKPIDSAVRVIANKKDSLPAEVARIKHAQDSVLGKKTDSLLAKANLGDSMSYLIAGSKPARKDSLSDSTRAKMLRDTAIRYFIAFHHVRIFNDSLQSVCDSLYYSSEDSIFRLFQQPLVFSSKSQISGDTIYMYTKNKKPARLYVFENGIIINKANERMYNQIAGRTLNGYFKDGELDYVRAKGSPAESVYYPQDEDSAYIGMNRSKGDVIDIFFVNKEVNKVKFINEVDGTLYPLRQTPEDQKYLKNYKWLDGRRPKNKLELFD